MSFAALFLLLIGITFLYAAWRNASPFVVARAFLENKDVDDYATK